MIVKNEIKVLERCFTSVAPYIDYWVICDTGSTDGTQELIQKWFKEKEIEGELHEDSWVDFSTNRNLALDKVRGKSDWILIIDADEQLIPDQDFVWPEKLEGDCYNILTELGDLTYVRKQLIRNGLEWRYHGVCHEYIHCDGAKNPIIFRGIKNKPNADGARSTDPLKFQKDALLFKGELLKNPDDERSIFYLAQSYKDCGKLKKACKYYLKRAKMGGWDEERYISWYEVGRLKEIMGEPFEQFSGYFLLAHTVCPDRLEAINYLVNWCRLNNQFELGYQLGKGSVHIHNSRRGLFLQHNVYRYVFQDNVAICAYYTNRLKESFELYVQLFRENRVPESDRKRILNNQRFSANKLGLDVTDDGIIVVKEINKESDLRVERQGLRVVVGLTTIPSRFTKIPLILQSLLGQTEKPDHIYVVIPWKYKRFEIDEKQVEELQEKIDSDLVEIIRVEEDYGPASKLIGILEVESDPNTIVITVDDDTIYDKHIVRKLIQSVGDHECNGAAVGFCGWGVTSLLNDGEYDLVYEEEREIGRYMECDIVEGYRGVAYRRGMFDLDQIKQLLSENECLFKVDDVLISGYLALQGIKRFVRKYNHNGRLKEDEVWGSVWKQLNYPDALSRELGFRNLNKEGVKLFSKLGVKWGSKEELTVKPVSTLYKNGKKQFFIVLDLNGSGSEKSVRLILSALDDLKYNKRLIILYLYCVDSKTTISIINDWLEESRDKYGTIIFNNDTEESKEVLINYGVPFGLPVLYCNHHVVLDCEALNKIEDGGEIELVDLHNGEVVNDDKLCTYVSDDLKESTDLVVKIGYRVDPDQIDTITTNVELE